MDGSSPPGPIPAPPDSRRSSGGAGQKRLGEQPAGAHNSKKVTKSPHQSSRKKRRRKATFSTPKEVQNRRTRAALQKKTEPEKERVKSEPIKHTWTNKQALFQRGLGFPKGSFGARLDVVSWDKTSMTEADHRALKVQIRAYIKCDTDERAKWLEDRMTPRPSNGEYFAVLKGENEVIAARDLRQWELLGHYAGEAHTHNSIQKLYKKYGSNNIVNYVMQAGEDYLISAFDKSNVCSLINAGRVYATELREKGRVLIDPQRPLPEVDSEDELTMAEELVIPENVTPMFATRGNEIYVFIVSNRDIRQGEILWMDYGIGYWRRLQLPIVVSSGEDESDMEAEDTPSSTTLPTSTDTPSSHSPSNEMEVTAPSTISEESSNRDEMEWHPPELPPVSTPLLSQNPPSQPPSPPEEVREKSPSPEPVYPPDVLALMEVAGAEELREKALANLELLKEGEIDFRKFCPCFNFYSKELSRQIYLEPKDIVLYLDKAKIISISEMFDYMSLTTAAEVIEDYPHMLDQYLADLWQKGRNLSKFCKAAKGRLSDLKESNASEWTHADLLAAAPRLREQVAQVDQNGIDRVYNEACEGSGDDAVTTQLLILAHRHPYALRKYIELKLTKSRTDSLMNSVVKRLNLFGVPIPGVDETHWTPGALIVFYLRQAPEDDNLRKAFQQEMTIKSITSLSSDDPLFELSVAQVVRNWLKTHGRLTTLFKHFAKFGVATPKGAEVWNVSDMSDLLKRQGEDYRLFPATLNELSEAYLRKRPRREKAQERYDRIQISHELFLRAHLGEPEALNTYMRLRLKFDNEYELFRDLVENQAPVPPEVGEWTFEKLKKYLRDHDLVPGPSSSAQASSSVTEQPMELEVVDSIDSQQELLLLGAEVTLSQSDDSDSDSESSDHEASPPPSRPLRLEDYTPGIRKVMETWGRQVVSDKLSAKLEGIRNGTLELKDLQVIFRYPRGGHTHVPAREILHYLEQEKLITHGQAVQHLTAEMALERIQNYELSLDEYMCHLWETEKSLNSFFRETGGRLAGITHGKQDKDTDSKLLDKCPSLVFLLENTNAGEIDIVFHRACSQNNDEPIIRLLYLAHKHDHALKRYIEYKLRDRNIDKTSLQKLASRFNQSGVPPRNDKAEKWTAGDVCGFYLSQSRANDSVREKMMDSMTISGLKGLSPDQPFFREAVTGAVANLMAQGNSLGFIQGQLKANKIPVPFDNARWNAKTLDRLTTAEQFSASWSTMLSNTASKEEKHTFWATEALVRAFKNEPGALKTYIKLRMKSHGAFSKLVNDLNENEYLTPEGQPWTRETVRQYIALQRISLE